MKLNSGFTFLELLMVLAVLGFVLLLIFKTTKSDPEPTSPSDVPPHLREIFVVTPITSEARTDVK